MLAPNELKAIRRSVMKAAVEMPLSCFSRGEISAGWYYLKELYAYRILLLELVDSRYVLIYTKTNSYPGGMRRPDFVAGHREGAWEGTLNMPIL